jgi:hypothetical protein
MAIARTSGFAGTRRGLLGGAAATGISLAACGGTPPAQTLARSAAPVTLDFMHHQPIKKEQFAPAWPTLSEKAIVTIEVDNTNDSNQTKTRPSSSPCSPRAPARTRGRPTAAS